MSAIVVVVEGLQWGDEGKGKIVDALSEYRIVCRFQGGHNAGHTVVVRGKTYIFHLIPSAILDGRRKCVIGHGVVVDPRALLDEIDLLKQEGYLKRDNQLLVSPNAHVIMPYHVKLDRAREEKLGKNKIGTTARGIGPCYEDKAARCGIRLGDLLQKDYFQERLKAVLELKNFLLRNFYHRSGVPFKATFEKYLEYGQRLIPYLADTEFFLNQALARGKQVLFEGAQGTMLDLDSGTYPFVTSSSTIAGGACTGSGIAPTKIDRVIGVLKAYTTRVGEGPFPTEIKDVIGDQLRKRGCEFGATTGRPRRCGWLDLMIAQKACIVNGVTEIALTKLDVLDGMKKISVCVAYEDHKDINGSPYYDSLPPSHIFERVTPVYGKELSGWPQEQVAGITSYHSLPKAARRYIEFIEDKLNIPIRFISTGNERESLIKR